MPRLLPLLSSLLLGATTAMAQGTPAARAGAPEAAATGDVQGTVVEGASGQPIAHASVALRAGQVARPIAGAYVTPAGAFRLTGIRPGTYTLRVMAIGFSPLAVPVTVDAAHPAVALGALRLTRIATALQDVQVTAAPAAVNVQADRIAYRPKSLAPAASSASEVLENVPSVQVDVDGTVSLRGSTNVVVQINGRPSPLTGTQLGAFLKSLPASTVERIEVLPNPSAKYDAEGMAGIINIVLKQNTDLGLSGGANGSAGPQGADGTAQLGYQHGALTSFTSLGHNDQSSPVTGLNDRASYGESASPLGITDQSVDGSSRRAGTNLTSTLELRPNARDLFTNALVLNVRTLRDAATTGFQDFDGAGALLDRYDRLRDDGSTGRMVDYTTGFRRAFRPRVHELSVEVRGSQLHDREDVSMWLRDGAAGSRPTQGEIDHTDAVTRQLFAQLDYVRPLGALKLETGVKGTGRWIDRDFAVRLDSLGDGAWRSGASSNAVRLDETVQAAYGLLSGGHGRVQLQGGMRTEVTERTFDLASTGSRYPYRSAALFPSANVLVALDAESQVKVGYSRRIRRPGTQELNPFPNYMDAQNVFLGSPGLAPEYTDALELGYTRSGALGSFQLTPFFRRTTNPIRFVVDAADTLDGRTVTSIRFENLPRSDSWGTDVNQTVRLGQRLSGFVYGSVFHQQVSTGAGVGAPGTDALMWMTRANATFQATPATTLQAFWMYRGPQQFEGGTFHAMQTGAFTILRKLDGDNASVSLRVRDPFGTNRMRVDVSQGGTRQFTDRYFGARTVLLGFQYAYGKPPKVRQPDPSATQPQGAGFP